MGIMRKPNLSYQTQKNPRLARAGDHSDCNLYELGSTTLTVQVFVILLVLAAFFLLVKLVVLLAGLIFLALLTGLATLLARLGTTLTISFHIICHKQTSRFMRRGGACAI